MIIDSSPFDNKVYVNGNRVGNLGNYIVYGSFNNCCLITLDTVIAIIYKD